MVGRHAWDFLNPEEREPFRAAMMDRMARGAETEPFECGYVLEDGSRLTWRFVKA